MITVNMHEAKTRLSELVKAVEEENERVILCRQGKPVAELTALRPVRRRLLKPEPSLKVILAPGFDPAEPASEEDWPQDCR